MVIIWVGYQVCKSCTLGISEYMHIKMLYSVFFLHQYSIKEQNLRVRPNYITQGDGKLLPCINVNLHGFIECSKKAVLLSLLCIRMCSAMYQGCSVSCLLYNCLASLGYSAYSGIVGGNSRLPFAAKVLIYLRDTFLNI